MESSMKLGYVKCFGFDDRSRHVLAKLHLKNLYVRELGVFRLDTSLNLIRSEVLSLWYT